MFSFRTKAAVALNLLLLISACTDKDREMAKRASDGSETFKFTPPPEPKKTSSKPAASTSRSEPKSEVKNDSEGTDTFKFKQDPRYFPKPKQQTGK